MDPHPLKVLLQLHLGSDACAALHLPHILSSINAEVLQPSAHTPKWTTRVHSLLHSKDAPARWAGLCIALQTSIFSRQIMMENAQGWVTVALPVLSKKDTLPTLKAAIRLLRFIFAEAGGFPEFQRQVATPNVPKFSHVLVSLAEKNEDEELQVHIMETLMHLVPLYPTLHRVLLSSLSNLALRHLNGCSPKPTAPRLLRAASGLYSILHYTGGKVGAANQWRKSMDDTLAFAWGALQGLRTTFPDIGQSKQFSQQPLSEDPMLSTSLHLDRLRAAVTVLSDLMRTTNPRAVVLPVGQISRLCVALLACSADVKLEGHVEPVVHSLERSIVPSIWELGCRLIHTFAECAKTSLTPHLSQLLFHVSRHLESVVPVSRRLPFLHAASALLAQCQPLGDPVVPSRLARAVLPVVAVLLALQSQANCEGDSDVNGSKSRKGKKRARAYEGDELFKTREIICASKEDGEAVLLSLEILRYLLQKSPLSAAVQSIITRTLLAICVSLPLVPPSLFSSDLSLQGQVHEAVRRVCAEIGTGTTSTMNKSLGLLIGTSLQGSSPPDVLREIELMLHPRVPPQVRALPHVDLLSLFRAEESNEERAARHEVGLVTIDEIRSTRVVRDGIDTDLQFVSAGLSLPSSSLPPQQTPPFTSSVSAGDTLPAPQSTVDISPGTGPPAAASTSLRLLQPDAKLVPAPVTTPAFLMPPPRSPALCIPPDPLPSSFHTTSDVSVPPRMSSKAVAEPGPLPVTMHMDVEEEDEPMPGIDLGSDSETD